jgi:uridylate kinase
MAKPKYRRVIVKLSGEALSGPEKFGIHQPTIDRFAADLVAAHRLGVGLGVVVGGGNVLRGAKVSEDGLSRPTADAMGMLATVMNALVLEAAIERVRFARPMSVSGRCAISKTTGSSCSPGAPAIRISQPTQPRSCAPPKWNATPS